MSNLESNFNFKVMAFMYKIRDFLTPRIKVLEEVGIKPGSHVLDYGCGPGAYLIPLLDLTGNSGQIYALDVHPVAIEMVKKTASEKGLMNVKTILSDCNTGLSENSLDVVLIYDVFHDLDNQSEVLRELHKILKADGLLSFSDHHMKDKEIISKMTNSNLFKLIKKGRKTYTFSKAG
jgi:ubiquinone/menaquinone biosynthesis C-methylase UbiE